MRQAVTACATAVLALVGLVGCGTASPSDRARPARLYPFGSAVYYTADEERTIDQKLERATASCMRSRGFTYPPTPTPVTGFRSASEPDNPYVLLGLETARTDGYGIVPAEVRDRRRSQPTASATPTANLRYDRALVGDQQRQRTLALPDGSQATVAADGCVARARETVFGTDWDRLYYTVQALSNMVITRTGADPAVVDTLTTWSSCLDRAGYQAGKPEDLRAAIRDRAQAAVGDTAIRAVARAELAVAEADASCQDQANLHQVMREAQQRAEQQVLNAQFRRDLEQLRQRRQAVLGH